MTMMGEYWMYRGDGPPRWVTSRHGSFWYLRKLTGTMGDGTATYLLSSSAMKDKKIKARNPELAQAIADLVIMTVAEKARREQEHYRKNRVWVVSYCDPHDSLHPGVWGVYRTADFAETEAASCEAEGWTNVSISERGLDFPGTQDWWHLGSEV
jgi:hypothetical protein